MFIAIVSIFALGSLWLASRRTYLPKTAGPPEASQTPTQPQGLIRQLASVGIIDQFYSESPSFTDEAVQLLKSQNISVNTYRTKEVTVELYRKLPTFSYDLIVLRVHAGILERLADNQTFLFTTEPFNTSSYVWEQLLGEIMSGVITPGVGEQPVFTVGPLFVRLSMEGSFNGTTIILSSCLGLYNHYLAEALIEQGASVFIGWNKTVSLEHTDKATLTLLKALVIEKTSVKEAVAKAMKEVGPDPTYKSILLYYPPDRGTPATAASGIMLSHRFEKQYPHPVSYRPS